MGQLLISGDGKNMHGILTARVITMVSVFIVSIAMFILSGYNPNYDPEYPTLSTMGGPTQQQVLFTILGVILLILFFILLIRVITDILKARTKINVYENIIEGSAIEKNAFSFQNFKIAYDQISNVDLVKKLAVIIYTPYTKYTCYAVNCSEIRDMIIKQQNLLKGEPKQ